MLVDEVINTLQSYDEAGAFVECSVEFWPDDICLTGGREESAILSQYREFQAWADREGVSLEPGFTRRERTQIVGEGSETVLVLPVVCLAIRVRGKLVSVAPHTTQTKPYTVTDALADIEALPNPQSKRIDDLPPSNPIRSALTPSSASRTSDRIN